MTWGWVDDFIFLGWTESPVEKKQHMLVRYVGSWFEGDYSWFCAGPKQLAPAQDQLITSLNQLITSSGPA